MSTLAPTAADPRTRERLLMQLKMHGPSTVAQLARHLGVTAVAVRQQLDRLLADDLVQAEDQKGKVGRPARWWRLADAARSEFPDTHAALTVELIASVRATLGDQALDRVVAARHQQMLASYQQQMADVKTLAARLRRLAKLRSDEGYMATVERAPDGSWLLLEHHCPICAAASACQGFCARELELFQAVLPGLSVVREEHLLADGQRCAYRIRTRTRTRTRTRAQDQGGHS